ncbi:UNVERIFIED_CONTAM: hypothetical protein Sangu_2886600 [Sesamum angustifolium]|uniref:NAD(P)H dehydrogenase (quinone) n=1 Tax=Sesamum angustifolium TaxID=2727405 RepID=A0AAW2IMB1_9LAMI
MLIKSLGGSGRQPPSQWLISLLSMPKTNRFAFAEPGLRVRAQQQTSAETETGRRAMLGLLAAGMASGKNNSRRNPRLISEKSDSQGLIRAAAKLHIGGLVLLPVDVSKLPLINVEDHPNLPTEVQAFMDQILLADAILFSAPEYNYSVTRNKPQTLISYSFLNAICTQTFDYDVPSTDILSLWWLMEYRTFQLLLKMQLIGYPRGQKLWLVKLLQSSARDGISVGAECSIISGRLGSDLICILSIRQRYS